MAVLGRYSDEISVQVLYKRKEGGYMTAEQAQSIAEIKRLMKTFGATVTYSYADMHTAISLVDSQSQNIAASATVIDEMHAHTVTLNALYLQAENKIAEQAKEIDRLNKSKGEQNEI